MTGNGHRRHVRRLKPATTAARMASQPLFDTRLGYKDCSNRDFGLSLWSRMGECLLRQECALRVKRGHQNRADPCPLFPRKMG